MRIFIAIPLPDDLKDRIAAVQERLKKVPADVSWVGMDKFHLTLKFLGEVPDDKVPAVAAAVQHAVAGGAPFAVTLHGLGAFPDLRAPRVIWVGLRDGEPQLRVLAETVDGALAALGFAPEKRRFSGHLTLGRVRSRANLPALVTRIESLKETPFGSCTVDRVALMRSILHPQGSEYQCLQSISI
jgi:2'-5' RNA ligase